VNLRDVVEQNLRKDFENLATQELSGESLAVVVVVGFGTCQRGVVSEVSDAQDLCLMNPKTFPYEVVLEIIRKFNARNLQKPLFQSLLLCVNVRIPSRPALSGFVHRLYELDENVRVRAINNELGRRAPSQFLIPTLQRFQIIFVAIGDGQYRITIETIFGVGATGKINKRRAPFGVAGLA